ncbi:hypothetical protein B566_EDAN007993 [Ephemera danica]|nr:hypothetical protein B566_EDAN007993 [Ephemera danica]
MLRQLTVALAMLLGFSRGQHHQQTTHHGYNAAPAHYGVSRHFAHFSGPVSGAEHEVVVPRGNAPAHHHQVAPVHYHHQAAPTHHHASGTSVDYVARPDYKFGYGIEDSKTGNKQSHEESRDGDVVRGQYTVLEPDGSMRIVQYTADPKNGFQAVVKRTGHAPEVHGAPSPPEQHNQHEQEDDEDYD